MLSSDQIRDKTAIITGSGRGIGKETAIILAKRGANVVVCSRTQSEIDCVIREIKEIRKDTHGKDDGVLGITCDVSKSAEVNTLIERTIEKFGNIDILVNNAGIVFVKELIDISEEEWDLIMDINLKGTFLCTKAVLPSMFKQRLGIIINVSSGAGKIGFPNISAYCASKFGMMGITESLAWEIEKYNIKVMSICPGEVDTKMQESVDAEYYRENKNKMLKPSAVAEKIVDMIINNKHYKNGQSVDIY